MKYLLYSGSTKFDRLIASEAKDYICIDWTRENEKRSSYISEKNPLPSNFPAIVDSEIKIILCITSTLKDAEKELQDKIDIVRANSSSKYKLLRKQAYEKNGLDTESWIRALVQKEVDNDPTEYNNLVAKRKEIKKLHKKTK